MLVMADNLPSACGNDFALDDITSMNVKTNNPVTPKTTPTTNP
jgi:hypothetical protein